MRSTYDFFRLALEKTLEEASQAPSGVRFVLDLSSQKYLCDGLDLCEILWLAEVVEDEADLVGCEEFLCFAVAGALKHIHKLGVVMDPFHQAVDGTLLGEGRGVGHGEL